MSERFPSNVVNLFPRAVQEKGPEQLLSEAEIRAVFERLIGGREHSEMVSRINKYGDTVYEIATSNERGDKVEYELQYAKHDYRDADIPSAGRFSASIHRTEYDGDMPVGGQCVANYLDGEWRFVRE